MPAPTGLSFLAYTGNGSNTDFTFNKPYLARAHVKVYVDGVLKVQDVDYEWISSSEIRFDDAPASDAFIQLIRQTPRTTDDVDFQPGGLLGESIMDFQYLQPMFILQELLDKQAHTLSIPLGATELAVNIGLIDDVKISNDQNYLQQDRATVEWKLSFDDAENVQVTLAKDGETTENIVGIGQCL